MTGELRRESATNPPEGGYFGERPACFGMLHRPDRPASHGVVIVNDFGYRGMCVYWTLRRLAARLAARGHLVLRFDLPGTGDSPAVTGNRVDVWPAALAEAVSHLTRSGVERVSLVGVGLGALLALEHALADARVPHVELVQPFSSGERYLAFLDAGGPPARPTKRANGGYLVSDHFLSEDEVASVRATKVDVRSRSPVLDACFVAMAGDDADDLAKRLEGAGHACTSTAFGEPEVWLQDPMYNAVPSFFDAIVERLDRRAGASEARDACVLRPTHAPPEARYAETALAVAATDGEPMHAVLATPATSDAPTALVLVMGTAANRRSGMHDQNTHWARALATDGIATLRFDASGFGDSNPRRGFADNEVLVARNHEDAMPLLDAMRERGFRAFGVFGLSSGGYTALRVMLDDPSVVALFGVNVARFVAETLDESLRKNLKPSNWYWTALRDPSTWRRFLGGNVHVRDVASALLVRGTRRAKNAATAALGRLRRSREVVLGEAHRNVLTALGRPGGRVHLVYCDGDLWTENFERDFGPRGARLEEHANLTMTFLEGVDHGISDPLDAARVAKLACDLFASGLSART